jgi:pilus assembly protein CpaE
MDMKALVITRDAALHATLLAQGAARSPPLRLLAGRTSLADALERPPAEAPELVIVDAGAVAAADVALLERLPRLYPRAALLLLLGEQQQQVLMAAMRCGVREVLPLPLAPAALHETLDRIDIAAGVSERRDGKVLAFISCKGGSGATFLATNFGYALGALAGKKVLLIDLHGQFGDAALYVSDQKPAMTLADVCAQIDRLDGALLASCLVHVSAGFGVLAAADDAAAAVRPEHMDALLRVARQYYDYTVLDVGRQIDAVTLRALDGADAIYPVLQLALPDIRDGRRLLDIFGALGYGGERVHLIVNRYEKGGKLSLADLERALASRVLYAVPNDYVAATDSVNQGVPVLRLSRTSAVARSLAELVALVAAVPVVENKSLFGRLFGRTEVPL